LNSQNLLEDLYLFNVLQFVAFYLITLWKTQSLGWQRFSRSIANAMRRTEVSKSKIANNKNVVKKLCRSTLQSIKSFNSLEWA